MTITITRKVLVIALAIVGAVLAVTAISYATQTVTGDREYISCVRQATETQLDAYEKYIAAVPQTDTDSEYAQRRADFVLLERQYINDMRAC